MIDRARSYFLGAAFISTTSLFIFAGLLTSMPFLFDLNVFSDSTAQPNRSGELAITETAISGGGFLIGTVISLSTLGSKTRKINSTLLWSMGAVYALFSILQLAYLFERMDKTGVLNDWGWNDGTKTCNDASFTGCPIARFLSINTSKIETISDCKFNAFDVNNINEGQGASQLVDWSNRLNYDSANVNLLATAAQSAGMNVDADAMEPIYTCWYWGCNSVCNDRYKLNRVYIGYAAANAVFYIMMSVLLFLSANAVAKGEDLGEEKRATEEPPVEIPDDDDFTPYSSSIKSSTNNEISSSDKVLYLNLRI